MQKFKIEAAYMLLHTYVCSPPGTSEQRSTIARDADLCADSGRD